MNLARFCNAATRWPSKNAADFLKIDFQTEKGAQDVPNVLIIVTLEIEYGVNGDLIIIYPKAYSIYFRGTGNRVDLLLSLELTGKDSLD